MSQESGDELCLGINCQGDELTSFSNRGRVVRGGIDVEPIRRAYQIREKVSYQISRLCRRQVSVGGSVVVEVERDAAEDEGRHREEGSGREWDGQLEAADGEPPRADVAPLAAAVAAVVGVLAAVTFRAEIEITKMAPVKMTFSFHTISLGLGQR